MSTLIILAVAAAFLFLIPLWPSLRELQSKKDARPLAIADTYPEERHKQAERFGDAVRSALTDAVREFRAAGSEPGTATRALEPRFEVIGPKATGAYDLSEGNRPLVLIQSNETVWPSDTRSVRPVYATGRLAIGPRGDIRGIFVDGDAHLGDESQVHAWLHARRNLQIDSGCTLCGSVQAGKSIIIGPGTRFERLQAEEIRFGDTWHWPHADVAPHRQSPDLLPLFRLHGRARALGPGNIVDADLLIPSGHKWTGNIVVLGDLRIGKGAFVEGSVKVRGKAILEQNSRLDGQLFAEKGIELRSGSVVSGTAATEGKLHLRWGSEAGQASAPATVTGATVLIDQGARVYGVVVAEIEGRVATRTGAQRAA